MKKQTKKIATGIGAGVLAAAALAAAGAYILSDEKNQKKLKAWAVSAKKEIVKKVQQAKELSEGQYKNIVDQAMARYGSLSQADRAEIAKVGKDLKGQWALIQKHAKTVKGIIQKKKGAKTAKATTKKTKKSR